MTERKKRWLEYLKTDHWKALRKQAFERDGWKCTKCGSTTKLHGHHKIYRANLSDGIVDDIQTLCEPCHNEHHRIEKKLQKSARQSKRAKKKARLATLPDAPPSGDIVITHKLINALTNCGRGITKKNAALVGVSYPLRRGWFKKLQQIADSNKNGTQATAPAKNDEALCKCPRCGHCFTVPDKEPECPF